MKAPANASRRPSDKPFNQQSLKNWSPKLPPYGMSVFMVVLGIIFIPIGSSLIKYSKHVYEQSVTYDSGASSFCSISSRNQGRNCSHTFELTRDVNEDLFLYYEVEHFYQNHRRYFASKSIAQLMGENLAIGEVDLDCSPLVQNYSLLLNPCGLIANSFVNDQYTLLGPSTKTLNETNIALPSDKQYLFKQVSGFMYKQTTTGNETCAELGLKSPCKSYTEPGTNISYRFYYPDDSTVQYLYESYPNQISPILGVTDEHFIVWMRTAGLPTFRKLYGRIPGPFTKGDQISIGIIANYEVDSFGGSKALILTTVGAYGGQNSFPGIAFVVTGSVAFAFAAFFAYKDYRQVHRSR